MVHRDLGILSWYHCVLAWDSTQGISSNRIKFYVNGTQYTVSTSGGDILNHVMPMNKSGLPFRIGSQMSGGSYFEGVMSHMHFVMVHNIKHQILEKQTAQLENGK